IQEMCRAERIIDDAKGQEEIEVYSALLPGPRGHSDEEKGKLAAVHFVRFAFSPEAVEAFRSSDADLVVDPRPTRARPRLSAETKAELLTDLVSCPRSEE